eukprot:g4233.t1
MSQSLLYFPLRARGEALRFIARYGKINLVDEIVGFPKWVEEVKEAMPKKQLPVLKYNGKKLMPESVDIGIYLAEQTDGKIIVDDAQINIAKECGDRPLNNINPLFNWYKAAESDKQIAEYFENVAFPVAKKYNALLGNKKYFGGETLGLGDFFYFHILDLQHTVKPKMSEDNNLTELFEWKERMQNLEGVKDYLSTRPVSGNGEIGRNGSIALTRSLG